MRASELRIGNYVHDPTWGTMVIESILGGTLRVYLHTPDKEYLADFPLSGLQPIPLTEEWLIKFGFDIEWTIGGFLKWEKLVRYERKFKLLDRRLPHPQYHAAEARIEYVHQLQNLYFCLTGEELTIK